MIAPSEFNAISARGLGPVTLAITNKYNGENIQPGYYFRRFFTPKYSLDGTYNALSIYNKRIVADIVALDSALPLKSRASVGSAKGELPKIGTERNLNESELRQLRLMLRADSDELMIMRTFFQDVDAVYSGVLEQWEALALQAMSTGLILVTDATNVGAGIRVNFGYVPANMFNATIVWGQTNYTPISDLIRVAEKAGTVDGNPIETFFMNRAQLNQILASTEARNLYAQSQGNQSGTFNPTLDQINSALVSNYGWKLEVITRSVTYEINGVTQTINPWAAGQIVGLSSEQVGSLVWSDVEESASPVAGVNYSTGENGILIKQYKLVRPSLKQITASEAVSMPVISDVNRIYKLDTTAVAV